MQEQSELKDIDRSDGTIKLKGLTICYGKVKARVCVAMNLKEAQNIKVRKKQLK